MVLNLIHILPLSLQENKEDKLFVKSIIRRVLCNPQRLSAYFTKTALNRADSRGINKVRVPTNPAPIRSGAIAGARVNRDDISPDSNNIIFYPPKRVT